MTRLRTTLVASFCTALVGACAGDVGNGADEEATPTPECPIQWEAGITPSEGSTSTIANGSLTLAAPSMGTPPDHMAIVWRAIEPLSDDFEITITFSNFVSGGTGAFFQMVAADPSALGYYASGGIGNLSEALLTEPALSATVVPNVTYDEGTHADVTARAETSIAGTITLVRNGDTLTATATTTGATAAKSDAAFSNRDLLLALQLGNNHPIEDIADASSVSIDDVTGAIEDDFACNSLEDS